MGDCDDGGRIIADLCQRRTPFRDRHHHCLEEADFPAILLRILLDRISDNHAVVLRARNDRDLVVRPLPGLLFSQSVQERQQALAVPVFGRIAHEDAEIALRIVPHRLVVDDVGVMMDVDDASVCDDVIFLGNRTGVVAIYDGMDAVAVDEALHGRDDIVGALFLGVFKHRLQRPAENAAHGVDLVAGHFQRALELDAVGSCPAGQRHAAPDRNRFSFSRNALDCHIELMVSGPGGLVDSRQHAACGGKSAHLQELAPAEQPTLVCLVIRH